MPRSDRKRPVLVFHGDCGFCARCVRLLEMIGPDADVVAWQKADLAALGLTMREANDAVQWVEVDGTVRSGHEAIAGVMGAAGGPWKLIGRVLRLPGVSCVAARSYRVIAENRYRLPGSSPQCTPSGRRRQAAATNAPKI